MDFNFKSTAEAAVQADIELAELQGEIAHQEELRKKHGSDAVLGSTVGLGTKELYQTFQEVTQHFGAPHDIKRKQELYKSSQRLKDEKAKLGKISGFDPRATAPTATVDIARYFPQMAVETAAMFTPIGQGMKLGQGLSKLLTKPTLARTTGERLLERGVKSSAFGAGYNVGSELVQRDLMQEQGENIFDIDPEKAKMSAAMGAAFGPAIEVPAAGISAYSQMKLVDKIDKSLTESGGKAMIANAPIAKKFINAVESNAKNVKIKGESEGNIVFEYTENGTTVELMRDSEGNLMIDFESPVNQTEKAKEQLDALKYGEAGGMAIIQPMKDGGKAFGSARDKAMKPTGAKEARKIYDDLERNIGNNYQESNQFKSMKEAEDYWYDMQEKNNWTNEQLNQEIVKENRRLTGRDKELEQPEEFKDTGYTETTSTDEKFKEADELGDIVEQGSPIKAYGADFKSKVKKIIDDGILVGKKDYPKLGKGNEIERAIFTSIERLKKDMLDGKRIDGKIIAKQDIEVELAKVKGDIQDILTKDNQTLSDFKEALDNYTQSKRYEKEKTQAMHEAIETTRTAKEDFEKATFGDDKSKPKAEDVKEDTGPQYEGIKNINRLWGSRKKGEKGVLGGLYEKINKVKGALKGKKKTAPLRQDVDSIINDINEFTYTETIPTGKTKGGKPVTTSRRKWIGTDKVVKEDALDKAIESFKKGNSRALDNILKYNIGKRPTIKTGKKSTKTPEEKIARKHKKEEIKPSEKEDIAQQAKEAKEQAEDFEVQSSEANKGKKVESKYHTKKGEAKFSAKDEPEVSTFSGETDDRLHGYYDKNENIITVKEDILYGDDVNYKKEIVFHEFIHSQFQKFGATKEDFEAVVKILDDIFEDDKFYLSVKKSLESDNNKELVNISNDIAKVKNQLDNKDLMKLTDEQIKELQDSMDDFLKYKEELSGPNLAEEIVTHILTNDLLSEIAEGYVKKVGKQTYTSKITLKEIDRFPDAIRESLSEIVYRTSEDANSILYKIHRNESLHPEKLLDENKGLFKAIAKNSDTADKIFNDIKQHLDEVSWSGWLTVNAEHSAMMKLAGKIKGIHATQNEALAEVHKELSAIVEKEFKDVADADNIIGQMQQYGLFELAYYYKGKDGKPFTFDEIIKSIKKKEAFSAEDIEIEVMNYADSIVRDVLGQVNSPKTKKILSDEEAIAEMVTTILSSLTDKKKGKYGWTPAKMHTLINSLVQGRGGSIYTKTAYGKKKSYSKPMTRKFIDNSNRLDNYIHKTIVNAIAKEFGLKKKDLPNYKRNSKFSEFIDRQVAIRRMSSELAKKNSYMKSNLDKMRKIYDNPQFKILSERHMSLMTSLRKNNSEGNIFGINGHPEYQNSGYKWVITSRPPKEAIASGEKVYGNARFHLVPDMDVKLGEQESLLPSGYVSDFEKGIDSVSDVFMYDSKKKAFFRYEGKKKSYLSPKAKMMVENVKDLHGGKYQIKFRIPEQSKRRVRSSEGYANIYNYSYTDMFTRNQYLLNQSKFKSNLRRKYIQDAMMYGLLKTDETMALVDNKSKYVKVFMEDGIQYYAKKKWVSQFSGTKGVELRNKYAQYSAKITKGVVDIVRNNLIVGSISAFINSFVASNATYLLHTNNKMKFMGNLDSAKTEIKDYLQLLNKYGKQYANGKPIADIKKELESNDVFQAFQLGLQSTIRESNLVLGVNKRNEVHNMISQHFGVSKGFMDILETIHLRPNTKVGSNLGNLFDLTEITPKFALYKEMLKKTGDKKQAIDYVNNAFPNYALNLPEGISAMDDVIPFMKFFMSVPKMVHFGLINNPTDFFIMKLMSMGLVMGSYKALGETPEDEFYKDNNFAKLGEDTYYYTESLSNYNFSTPSPLGLNALERIYAPVDIMPLTIK